MEITKYNSQKLSVLSLLMIVLVIYIHGYYLEVEDYPISMAFQKVVIGFANGAVPLFYGISGFLFFKSVDSIKDCLPKICRRFHTLLIPYIIWNLVFVCWYLALTYLPGVSSFVNSNLAEMFPYEGILGTLYTLFIEPIGFHLWFLRDLLIFVMLTPILYWGIKKTGWWFLLVVLLLTGWIFRFWLTSFVFGATIAICNNKGVLDNTVNKKRTSLWLILYCLVALNNAFPIVNSPGVIGDYYAQFAALISIIAIWKSYDWVYSACPRTLEMFLKYTPYTFFIYLFHEPAFNIIKKLGLKVLGVNDLTLTFLYLINPIIMCVVAICVAKLAQRYIPRVYSVLVGGRS